MGWGSKGYRRLSDIAGLRGLNVGMERMLEEEWCGLRWYLTLDEKHCIGLGTGLAINVSLAAEGAYRGVVVDSEGGRSLVNTRRSSDIGRESRSLPQYRNQRHNSHVFGQDA